MHKVTIFVDGLFREFVVDDEQLINKDWNAVLEDMLDTIKKADKV